MPAGVVAEMLTSDATYATVLLVWAVDRLGFNPDSRQPNVFEWTAQTIREEVRKDTGVTLPGRNLDRLLAAVEVVTTDAFFKNVARFVQLANVLAGGDFSPDEFDPADSLECAWAVTEGLLLWPPDDEDPEPFCDDIRHYIGHVLREEGYVTPPDVLRIALGADFSGRVKYDFADDPELFGAIYDVQQDKTREVEAVIGGGLRDLLAQLTALRLGEGSTDEIAERIRRTLRGGATGTPGTQEGG